MSGCRVSPCQGRPSDSWHHDRGGGGRGPGPVLQPPHRPAAQNVSSENPSILISILIDTFGKCKAQRRNLLYRNRVFGLPAVKPNVMLPQLRDRGYVVSGARPLIVIMSVLLGYCGAFRTWPKNADGYIYIYITYHTTTLSTSKLSIICIRIMWMS